MCGMMYVFEGGGGVCTCKCVFGGEICMYLCVCVCLEGEGCIYVWCLEGGCVCVKKYTFG